MRRATVPVLLVLGLASVASAQAPANIYYNSFEYPDMRVAIPGPGDVPDSHPMTILPPGEMPNQPAGICVKGSGVCTSFNQGGRGYLNFVNDPANCHNGSNWCMRANLPSGVALNPGASVESGYGTDGVNPNIAQGCSTSSGPNSVCATRHWYFRYFIKWAPNFAIITAPGRTTCQGKIFYLRDWSGTTFIIVYRPVQQSAPGSNAMWLSLEDTSDASANRSNFMQIRADGNWHEFEMEVDAPNNHIRMWWDGNVVLDQAAGIKQPMSPENNHWGMYINNNAGADACAVVNNTSFWIDDLAVSTTRIGGGAVAPPTPPNPPSGLSLT
jgi:hypothetical protein